MRVNILRGPQGTWHTDIPTYARVHAAGVYPGVDLLHHANAGKLEYDFIVEPNADPSVIHLSFEGAIRTHVEADGSLLHAWVGRER